MTPAPAPPPKVCPPPPRDGNFDLLSRPTLLQLGTCTWELINRGQQLVAGTLVEHLPWHQCFGCTSFPETTQCCSQCYPALTSINIQSSAMQGIVICVMVLQIRVSSKSYGTICRRLRLLLPGSGHGCLSRHHSYTLKHMSWSVFNQYHEYKRVCVS